MTGEEFDKYHFSIKTEIFIQGIWRKVLGVNWMNNSVFVILHDIEVWLLYSRIEAIREAE